MNFGFSEEQELLRSEVRKFLDANAPLEEVRKISEDANGPGFSREVWKQIAELGWTGLIIPEEHEGDVPHRNFRGAGYVQFLPDASGTMEEKLERLAARIAANPDDARAYWMRGLYHQFLLGETAAAVEDLSSIINATRLGHTPQQQQLHSLLTELLEAPP